MIAFHISSPWFKHSKDLQLLYKGDHLTEPEQLQQAQEPSCTATQPREVNSSDHKISLSPRIQGECMQSPALELCGASAALDKQMLLSFNMFKTPHASRMPYKIEVMNRRITSWKHFQGLLREEMTSVVLLID